MAALLPVLGLIDNPIFRYSLVFDHFQYLASIGPLALAGTGLVRFSDFLIPKKSWLQSSLCAGLLLILGMASWQRTWVYESEETLWTDTLVKNPNCWVGHNNLGLVFSQKGQVDEALEHFQKALEIYANYAEAHSNLGMLFWKRDRWTRQLPNSKRPWKSTPTICRSSLQPWRWLSCKRGNWTRLWSNIKRPWKSTPTMWKSTTTLVWLSFKRGR